MAVKGYITMEPSSVASGKVSTWYAVASLGGAGGRPPRVTPSRGVTPEGKIFLWANLQRIVEKRGRTGKKKLWGDTLEKVTPE